MKTIVWCGMGGAEMKRVCYCGMGGNRHHAERLLPIIKELGARLRIISEWEPRNDVFPEIEYIMWELANWRDRIKECDIAIAPQDVELQPAKSSVKILVYMSLGVPVVASPLPAYKEIIVNDHNGYIAENDQQWKDFINILLYCTNEFREAMIRNAHASIVKFSPDSTSEQWSALLHKLGGAKAPAT